MIQIEHASADECLDIAHNFDSQVADPPYSRRVHAKAVSVNPAGRGSLVAARDLGFDCLTPALRRTIAQLAASVRGWSCVFSDVESAWLWRMSCTAAGAEYVRAVPWIRWSQPQLSGDRPPTGAELVSVFHRGGRKSWSGPGSLVDMPDGLIPFDAKSLRGRDKYSCEKPLDLALALVSWFSEAGQNVLDPVCGSGSTGLACRILEREALLVDVSADAVALAKARVASPLSDRDRERCRRFVEYQHAWLAGDTPNTKAGRERYARAEADTARVEAAL